MQDNPGGTTHHPKLAGAAADAAAERLINCLLGAATVPQAPAAINDIHQRVDPREVSMIVDQAKEHGLIDEDISADSILVLVRSLGMSTRLAAFAGCYAPEELTPENWRTLVERILLALRPPPKAHQSASASSRQALPDR